MKKEEKRWEDVSKKQKMLNAISSLPEDASYEEGMDSIVLLSKIERGMAQIASGQTVSHEEALARMAKWQK